jgi:calcium-dependent protein kinase
MKKIKLGVYEMTKYPWGIISQEAKDLINDLLQLKPNKRITAEEALKHKWFSTKGVKQMENNNAIKPKNLSKLLNNLTKYRSDNILRCAVIAYLVHNSTQLNQAHEAIKLFNKIDKNGDGKITREELFSGFQELRKKSEEELKKEVETVFTNIDTDHNGYIEYEEFIRAAIDKEYFLNEKFLRFAFNYFDRDHNGNITFEEIKNLFYQNDKNKNNQEAQNQLKKCFKDIDVNNDGELSFEEFVSMMKNIISSD